MAIQFNTAIRGLEYFSMTSALKHFRELFERDAGVSIDAVTVNAAELLDDIARHIGLSEARRAEVLGRRGAAHIEKIKSVRISLTVRH